MAFRQRIFCLLLSLLLLLLCGCRSTAGQEEERINTEEISAQEEEPPVTPEKTEPEPEPEPQSEPEAEPEPEPEPDWQRHEAFMQAEADFFRPDALLTRAECAQLLCNLTGADESDGCPYGDVPEEAWYYSAVCAATAFFPEEQWFFRPEEPITAEEFAQAMNTALELEQNAWPQALEQMWQTLAPETASEAEEALTLTRAQAASLLCRALGRQPDAEAVAAATSLLLDVPESRADYADIAEAVFAHDYVRTEEDGERWRADTLSGFRLDAGLHRKGETGYLVDADGNVVRGSGILEYGAKRYLALDETGRLCMRPGLQPCDGEAVYVGPTGALLRAATFNGITIDADGWYTTGDEALDEAVRAAIEGCTTPEMTREEKLRACYEYVRELKYLGRNPAYGMEVKTIPEDALRKFADKILATGKGDCYNFAAAFCLLARQLGYSARAIVGECSYYWNWNGVAHGWVEIEEEDGLFVYDPQIENYNLRAGMSNEIYSAYRVTYATAHAYYQKH